MKCSKAYGFLPDKPRIVKDELVVINNSRKNACGLWVWFLPHMCWTGTLKS